ncbi:MAG: hypothetical protein K6A93_11430 [Bacteroidaceae bacterium]|nr:hypothetical protein [Bacteroidaceae bacterium]
MKSLYRHMQFATLFPDSQIVSTASRQLSWSHFVELGNSTQQEIQASGLEFGNNRKS